MNEERFRAWLTGRDWRQDAIESICAEVLDGSHRIIEGLGVSEPTEEQIESVAAEERKRIVVDVSMKDNGLGTIQEIVDDIL